MIILGIDPAIRTTGYGVIEITGSNRKILDCGVIKNTPRMPHSECLRRLSGGIRELIDAFHPDMASMESPFVGHNASTAIILGMARGAIIASLSERNIPVYAYSPTTAKKAAVGIGKASKDQVALMMSAEFQIALEQIPLDATDALALAVCHADRCRTPELQAILTNQL